MKDDKKKRDEAVDEFAQEIKARLDEEAAKGFTGWDGKFPSNSLREELYDDAYFLYIVPDHINSIELIKIVDIGARAMMLYYRGKHEKVVGKL